MDAPALVRTSAEDTIAALEEDVSDLRAHNLQLQDELAKARASRMPAPRPPTSRATTAWAVAALLGVGWLVTIGFVVVTRDGEPARPPRSVTRTATTVDAALPREVAVVAAADLERPVVEPDAITPLLVDALERGAPHGRLVHLRVEGVRPDGSLDPAQGKLSALFLREVAPAEATDSTAAKGYLCHEIELAEGAWKEERVTYPGYCERFRDARLYRPRCSMKNVWALAREAAAPDGLASIDYRRDGTFYFFIYKGRDAKAFGASIADACR